jgi:tetratricopeptide (TPR) repeat protein
VIRFDQKVLVRLSIADVSILFSIARNFARFLHLKHLPQNQQFERAMHHEHLLKSQHIVFKMKERREHLVCIRMVSKMVPKICLVLLCALFSLTATVTAFSNSNHHGPSHRSISLRPSFKSRYSSSPSLLASVASSSDQRSGKLPPTQEDEYDSSTSTSPTSSDAKPPDRRTASASERSSSNTLQSPSQNKQQQFTPNNNNSNKQQPGRRRDNFKSLRGHIRSQFKTAKDLERKGEWRKAVKILQDILILDVTDAHSHLALARLQARRSPGTDNAVQAFRNGTAACPDSVHLWQAWAVHSESVGDKEQARTLFERALELDLYNPYVCHAYGLMERKSGNTDAAKQLWERALQNNCSTAALVCSLGEVLIAARQYEDTRDLYVQHLGRLQTEREKTEVYLASAWLEERYFSNFERAEELLKHSLAMSPTSGLTQVALARLEGRRRQQQQPGADSNKATVRRLANACIRIENGSSEDQPTDGRVYNAWANLEVKSRRFSAAQKILRKGIDRYPKDHSLLQAAGKVEERVGNYTGARQYFSASLCVQPSAPTLVAYAMLELRHPESGSSDWTKVKQLFEEALLLDPRHGPAYNAYGNAVLRKGDSEEARKVFERGARANCSDAASIFHGYASLELSCGNVDRARELLVQGRQKAQLQDLGMDSPHRERARFLSHTLGMLELNSNHPIDALAVFKDGIARFGNSSRLLLGAALCEVKLGNEGSARILFEKSVKSDERHAHAWQAWGVMEMRAGNWKSAQTLFECGLKSAPQHGALWHAYATMEGRLGNVENARALFAKGITKAPNHVSLYQGWALLELREEDFGAAKALITQALTRDKVCCF